METMKNKIDFAVVFNVKGANPNGDPLNGNRPRTNYDGLGEISDVCIKRKIRNRLMEMKNDKGEYLYSVFVQSDDNKLDDYPSLRVRAEGELEKDQWKNEKIFREAVCKKWIDVRAFGQVFAYGSEKKGEGDGTKKASDTMGMKHRVDHGVYVSYGAINPQLASKTWFEDKDAQAINNAIKHLFDNDASSARPEGSMEVVAVFWWQHNVNHGQYSSAEVHRSLDVKLKKEGTDPKNIEDYSIKLKSLSGLVPEIFNPNNVVIERI